MYDNYTSLSRVFTQSNHLYKSTNQATKKAFEPNSDLKLSVYNTTMLKPDEVVAIFKSNILGPTISKMYGYATLPVWKYLELKLEIDYNNIPIGHANIVSWPKEKEDRMVIQIALALASADSTVVVNYP